MRKKEPKTDWLNDSFPPSNIEIMPSHPYEDFEKPKVPNEQNPYPIYRKRIEENEFTAYYKILSPNSFQQIKLYNNGASCWNENRKLSFNSEPSTEAEFKQARRQFKEFAKLL